MLQESSLLVVGAMGAIVTLYEPARRFAKFAALWAFGIIAAYSLIAYKTPWLALNFIVPLALCSGVAIQWFYQHPADWARDKRIRWFALAGILLLATGPLPGVARVLDQIMNTNPWPGLLAAFEQTDIHWTTFIPGYQTIDLNFINY